MVDDRSEYTPPINVNACHYEDLLEAALERLFGERVRQDDDAAKALWSALSHIEWMAPDGLSASFTSRMAGEVVATLRGNGDYLDWYMSGPSGRVASWIAQTLPLEGWSWRSR